MFDIIGKRKAHKMFQIVRPAEKLFQVVRGNTTK